MSKDNYFKQILIGSGYGFIGKIIGSLIEFGFIIYITRNLLISHIGYYFIGLSVFRFIHAFSVGGMDYAARRFISISTNKNNLILIFIKKWILKLVLIYIGLIFYIFLSKFIVDDMMKTLMISGFIFTVPIATVVAIGTSILQGLKHIATATLLVDILVPLFRLILVYILINLNFNIQGVIAGYFLSFFLLSIITTYILIPLTQSENVSIAPSNKKFSYYEINKYSSSMMYISIINIMLIWGTTLVLGIFKPPEEVALYSVALRVATLSGLLLMSVNVIFEPIISELFFRNKRSELIQTYCQTTNIMLIVMILITIITVVFSDYIMILFGSEYISAQGLLIIIMFGQLFGVCAGPAGNILVMIGRQKISFYLNLIIAIVIILLDILFIPRYGILAAAVVTALGLTAKNSLALLYLYSKDKITPFNSMYLFIIITGVFGLLNAVIFRNSLPGFIGVIIFCIGYSILTLRYLLKFK